MLMVIIKKKGVEVEFCFSGLFFQLTFVLIVFFYFCGFFFLGWVFFFFFFCALVTGTLALDLPTLISDVWFFFITRQFYQGLKVILDGFETKHVTG